MKNNKGFMLAEAVITSTVVLTTLIGLYTTFNKLYNFYNIRTTYFDIDGIYAIKGMINHLIDNGNINIVLNNIENEEYYQITCFDNDNYCSSLQKLYNIQNMFVVKYDFQNISYLRQDVSNQTLKDYLDYITNYYNFNETDYSYLFIIEYKNGNNFYYSSLGLG